MAAFSGCLHSLESQRCGDVTAVGGQWGAAGMLPSVSGHITWRSGTVGHVGWDLSWSGVRSHAGCWYKTAHSWEPVRCLRERKDSHITVFPVSPVRRHRRESASELTVSWFYFWAVFFFFFPRLPFNLTLTWKYPVLLLKQTSCWKARYCSFYKRFFWGSYSQKIHSSYFCDLQAYEGEAGWERGEVIKQLARPLSSFLALGFCWALLLKLCDRLVSGSFHFQERRAQCVGCCVRNSKWANLLNKTWAIF